MRHFPTSNCGETTGAADGLAVTSRRDARNTALMGPNETELSHRWRERALLRSLELKSCESYSSERPAVGWSDWLDAFACAFRAGSKENATAPGIKRKTA